MGSHVDSTTVRALDTVVLDIVGQQHRRRQPHKPPRQSIPTTWQRRSDATAARSPGLAREANSEGSA